MKANKILLPLMIIPFLTGCGKKTLQPLSQGDNILTPEMLREALATNDTTFSKFSNIGLLSNSVGTWSFYSNLGITYYQDSDSKYHVVNLFTGKEFISGATSYTTDRQNGTTFHIAKFDNSTVIYDVFGNKIYEFSAEYINEHGNPLLYGYPTKETLALEITFFDDDLNTIVTKKFRSDGPDQIKEDNSLSQLQYTLSYDCYEQTGKYEGYVLLQHDDDYIASMKDGKNIGTYSFKRNIVNYDSIGKSFVVQYVNPVYHEDEEYDYIDINTNKKMRFETEVFDFTTGEIYSIPLRSELYSTSPIIDSGYSTYCCEATLRTYDMHSDRYVDKQVIIDEDLVLHEETTGHSISYFRTIGDYFYNSENRVLYDENLNPYKVVPSNYTINNRLNNGYVLLGNGDGQYCVANKKLEPVTGWDYKYVTNTYSDTPFITNFSDEVFTFNTRTEEIKESNFLKYLTAIYNVFLYQTKNDDSTWSLFINDKELGSYSNSASVTWVSISSWHGHNVYASLIVDITDGGVTDHQIIGLSN